MRATKFVLCGGAAALVLIAGCSAAKTPDAAPPDAAEAKQQKDPPLTDTRAAADRYMAGVEKAIRTRDIKPWVEVTPAEGRNRIKQKQFDTMLAALDKAGTLQSVSYLGVLDHTVVLDYLWKFTYERTEKDGQKMRTELLYLVRIYKAEDGFRFAGSGFKKI